MAGQDGLDARPVAEGVEDGQVVFAGHAVKGADAVTVQRLDQELPAAAHFIVCRRSFSRFAG